MSTTVRCVHVAIQEQLALYASAEVAAANDDKAKVRNYTAIVQDAQHDKGAKRHSSLACFVQNRSSDYSGVRGAHTCAVAQAGRGRAILPLHRLKLLGGGARRFGPPDGALVVRCRVQS